VPSKISETTAVAVNAHGFSVHWNLSRTIGCLQTYADESDLIVFAYDQEGHGYSGGERGVIHEYTHLVDDLVELVQLIYTAKEASSETYNLCPPEILADVQGRELAICGDSLGGGIALAATLRLQASPNRPAVLMLFAPFLQAHVPFGAGKSFVSVVKSIPSLRNMNLPQMLVPEFKGVDCCHCC
jgi:alpha-beta hydrolase superfamily lysophospholipase